MVEDYLGLDNCYIRVMGYVIIIVVILFIFWGYTKKRNQLNMMDMTKDTLEHLASIAVKENCLAIFQINPRVKGGGWINYKLISRIILDTNPNINSRKNINKDYIKIYANDNEKTITDKIKNLDDDLKIYIRFMIMPIFHKKSFLREKKGTSFNANQLVLFPTKFDEGSFRELFMSKEEVGGRLKSLGLEVDTNRYPSKKFINTAIDKYFDEIKVSSSFFESTEFEFLKKLN
jgi:hypothetical protein